MTSSREQVLAVIPARARSQRLAGKNLRALLNKPLIGWTIEAAAAASRVDRVVVSTESPEIAACARAFGAEVPIARPEALAEDDTPGIEPILHIVQWLADHEHYEPAIVVVLQPTSPLRTAQDIDDCLALMASERAEAVASVSPAPHPVSWLRRVSGDGQLAPLTCSGTGDEIYVLNGAVYTTTRRNLLATRSTYADPTYAYVMPRERSVDIDTLYDFMLAECILRARTQR